MQFCWRITKYNPKYRNQQGFFLHNEWTSYSDIGKLYGNKEFTYGKYLVIENLYIQAIYAFMNCCNITSLQIKGLEKQTNITVDIHNTKDMITLYSNIKEEMQLTSNQIEDICKLILREQLWCKLINNQNMYVHFGYDFYMYIGTISSCEKVIEKIQNSGLFIEKFESPYNNNF
jgi:hypothetical protein